MDTDQETPKKCFCARCFLPIDLEDKVDVEGQNFHRICSMCCICRTIPTSLKMFYGHVFCSECFKNHVLNRFKGDDAKVHSNSWWMQWAPGNKAPMPPKEEEKETDDKDRTNDDTKAESTKKCICARCLQCVDEAIKVQIGGQSFHPQCARCYFCHCVPENNVKIYYGQVFCERCFNTHVMNRNQYNPSEFFRNCFDQFENNTQFMENMKQFMGSSAQAPYIFMMQPKDLPQSYCRCSAHPSLSPEWQQTNEPKKSKSPPAVGDEDSIGTCDLSFENRTETFSHISNENESANQENLVVATVEKIAKLTKYLNENADAEKCAKKWKNFDNMSMTWNEEPSLFGWVDLQDPKVLKNVKNLDCPKCLWQCGSIVVSCDYFLK